jgi:hypothetical protein
MKRERQLVPSLHSAWRIAIAVTASTRVISSLWIVLGIVAPILKFPKDGSTFFVFYYSFHHLIQGNELHAAHPELHKESFLYGPLAAVLEPVMHFGGHLLGSKRAVGKARGARHPQGGL